MANDYSDIRKAMEQAYGAQKQAAKTAIQAQTAGLLRSAKGLLGSQTSKYGYSPGAVTKQIATDIGTKAIEATNLTESQIAQAQAQADLQLKQLELQNKMQEKQAQYQLWAQLLGTIGKGVGTLLGAAAGK